MNARVNRLMLPFEPQLWTIRLRETWASMCFQMFRSSSRSAMSYCQYYWLPSLVMENHGKSSLAKPLDDGSHLCAQITNTVILTLAGDWINDAPRSHQDLGGRH